MSAEIEFEDKELQEFFRMMNKNLKSIKNGESKYAGILSSTIYRDVIDHFQKEEGSEGPWPEWSLSYAMAVAKQGAFRRINGRTVFFNAEQVAEMGLKPPRKPGGILKDTGRLRQSFSPTNWRSVAAGILWYNNAQTKSGFPYAFAHNEGGDVLPKRDFMWASDQAMNQVAMKTLQFLIDEAK